MVESTKVCEYIILKTIIGMCSEQEQEIGRDQME